MSRLNAVAARAAGQSFGLTNYNNIEADLNYFAIAGADVASAATLNITARVHRVTGSTTIDNIADAAGASIGQPVKLLFQATVSVRHNGGGTGNIRLQAGLHAGFVAGEWLELSYDGTNWTESGRSPLHLSGESFTFSGSGTPSGTFAEDGSAISRTTYAALFANVGTSFGTGDGSTTFNLPDSRGRVDVGFAASGGHADVSTIGANEGVAALYRRPKHRTSLTDPGHTHHANQAPSGSTDSYPAGSGDPAAYTKGGIQSSTTGITIGTGNANDPLDSAAYLVRPKFTRI